MSKVVFTLYQMVKQSVAKCVSDRASSVYSGNASSRAIFALKTALLDLLLKVKCPVSDKVLKRSGHSLYTFLGAEIATEPLFGEFETTTTGSRCDPDRTGAVRTVSKWRNF